MKIFSLLFLLLPNYIYAEQPIRFLLPHFPPYAFEYNNEVAGIAVEKVSLILDKALLPYQFKLTTDYDRAIFEVKSGYADGFFLASQNSTRDNIAVFSLPVMQNAWSWFLPVGSALKPEDENYKQAKIGTIANTNTHKWLIKNNFSAVSGVESVELLRKMLDKGRIDAVFLSEAVFLNMLAKTEKPAHNYLNYREVVKPFGIYLSKSYLSQNPTILTRLNHAILQDQKIKQPKN